MIYELIIQSDKEKSVMAFLKQLDFVHIKKAEKRIAESMSKPKSNQKGIQYFGVCLDWDIDASELRSQSSGKHNQKW
jgi:hypothetical protein